MPHRLGKLFRVMARVHGRAVKPFGMSAVHAHILAVLWIDGAMTIGELQSELALGSSTMTGAIDRMERAGLVRRKRTTTDARAVRIEPAAWPARRREALVETLGETEDSCFGSLSRVERRQLGRLLDRALGGMKEVDDGDD